MAFIQTGSDTAPLLDCHRDGLRIRWVVGCEKVRLIISLLVGIECGEASGDSVSGGLSEGKGSLARLGKAVITLLSPAYS